MADLPLALQPHTVTVRAYLGSSAGGATYGDPVAVRCFADAKRRLIIASSGQQVTATATLHTTGFTPDTGARVDPALLFPIGSLVDSPSGKGRVEALSAHTDGGRGAWQHVEVSLT